MDLGLEIDNEGNSSEPLFHSIMNVVSSMKEATADKIYQRIQREGITQYSKPQVDRALASALKYGIFEVHNNQYRLRDDVLDDEETIYWRQNMKREQTPYRLEENSRGGDYIHPEKDRQTFRRLEAEDSTFCVSCGSKITDNNEVKERRVKYNPRVSSKNVNSSFAHSKPKKIRQIAKASNGKMVRKAAQGARSKRTLPKENSPLGKPSQRTINKTKGAKKKISKPKMKFRNTYEKEVRKQRHRTVKRPSKSSSSRTRADKVQSKNDNKGQNCECGNSGCKNAKCKDCDECGNKNSSCHCGCDAMADPCISEPSSSCEESAKSSYLEYMKEPFASQISEVEADCSVQNEKSEISPGPEPDSKDHNTLAYSNDYDPSFTWKPQISRQEENHLLDLFGKPDCLGNGLHNPLDGTIEQFDKGLKIEPVDCLSLRHADTYHS